MPACCARIYRERTWRVVPGAGAADAVRCSSLSSLQSLKLVARCPLPTVASSFPLPAPVRPLLCFSWILQLAESARAVTCGMLPEAICRRVWAPLRFRPPPFTAPTAHGHGRDEDEAFFVPPSRHMPLMLSCVQHSRARANRLLLLELHDSGYPILGYSCPSALLNSLIGES